MRQLAKLAGVSVSTVSLALRDDPRLPQETRRRIKELATQYGYFHNRLAQGLFTGKSGMLGCIIHQSAGSFYSRILHGVLDEAFLQDRKVIVLQSRQDHDHVATAVHSLLEHRVDGIIFAIPYTPPLPRALLLEIRSVGAVPVTITNSTFTMPTDRVEIDEDALAELAVDYLWRLGHREIGFYGGLLDQRTKAFSKALARHGLRADRVQLAPSCDPCLHELLAPLFKWLRQESPPLTALVTFDDVLAELIIFHCFNQGIRVPQDFSVMGIGNFMGTTYPLYLTTVEQSPDMMGREAVALIMKRIAEGSQGADFTPETRIVSSPTIIERHTCAKPRGR